MAATVSQVLTGLKNRLGTISGLRVYDYQPDEVRPPVAFPTITAVEYHSAFGNGECVYRATIQTICGRVSDRAAQTLLDGFASNDGASSIRGVIEGDPTLGGIVDTLSVQRSGSINYVKANEADFLTFDIEVIVYS
jgi:hypothetical protein